MRSCPRCQTSYPDSLRFCARDGSPLEDGAAATPATYDDAQPPAPTPARTAPPASDPLLGSVLDGRYRLIDRLGKGGMGKVYRACHEGTGRIVAVKVLHGHLLEEPTVVARFRREARAPALIDDPAVVSVLDTGEHPGVGVYYAMELIEGRSMSQVLKRKGPFPVDEIRTIFLEMLRALDLAHRAGVVHRDLKPENVLLVERPGEPPRVKLLDFGIAGILRDGGDEVTRLTQTGTVVGTPAFMSPEQAMGRRVDGSTDLYSVGVMIFWAATGRVPFTGKTALAVLQQHLSGEIPSLLTYNPRLPDELDAFVARSLAKEPPQRFGTATNMARALAAALPTEAERKAAAAALGEGPLSEETQASLRRALPRRRWSLLGLIAAVVLLFAGAAVLVGRLERGPTVELALDATTPAAPPALARSARPRARGAAPAMQGDAATGPELGSSAVAGRGRTGPAADAGGLPSDGGTTLIASARSNAGPGTPAASVPEPRPRRRTPRPSARSRPEASAKGPGEGRRPRPRPRPKPRPEPPARTTDEPPARPPRRAPAPPPAPAPAPAPARPGLLVVNPYPSGELIVLRRGAVVQRGMTPSRLQLAPGDYTLRLRNPASGQTTVREGQMTNVRTY